MRYPIGSITAIILSIPLSIMMFFSISNLTPAIYIVLLFLGSFAFSGLLYDFLLIKIRLKLTSSLKYVFFSGFFWLIFIPILRYCNEYVISIFLNQSILIFTPLFILIQSIFGFGFGLFYSIVYAHISTFLILKRKKNQN